MSWTLDDDIAFATEVLRQALDELARRIAAKKRDRKTDDLVGHCREMWR
jgi:hypothetical protein